MQAVILVGGEGTRLRPLTYAVPKPMAPLLGRPFIGWIIERLRAAGVAEIIFSCCYFAEAIEGMELPTAVNQSSPRTSVI